MPETTTAEAARLVADAAALFHVWTLEYCTDDGVVRTLDVFTTKVDDWGEVDYQIRRADTGAILSAWEDEATAISRAKWKMIDAWREEVGPDAVRAIYQKIQESYSRR